MSLSATECYDHLAREPLPEERVRVVNSSARISAYVKACFLRNRKCGQVGKIISHAPTSDNRRAYWVQHDDRTFAVYLLTELAPEFAK